MNLPEGRGRIRVVGLTGSIGTGKSTAARAFFALGVGVVDADEVARDVVAPGTPGLAAIAAEFGEGVVAADGSLDRAPLASVVFGDSEKRKKLEAIVHPLVGEEVARRISGILAESPDGFAVYDVPLLFETGIDAKCDLTVVVTATREEQAERLKKRADMPPEEVARRIDSQMELAEKARRADVVLENRGTPEDLAGKVRELTEAIRLHNLKKG